MSTPKCPKCGKTAQQFNNGKGAAEIGPIWFSFYPCNIFVDEEKKMEPTIVPACQENEEPDHINYELVGEEAAIAFDGWCVQIERRGPTQFKINIYDDRISTTKEIAVQVFNHLP